MDAQIAPKQQQCLAMPFGLSCHARGGRASMKTSTGILRQLQRVQSFPGADHVVIRLQHDHLASVFREYERFAKRYLPGYQITTVSKPPYVVRMTDPDGTTSTTDFRIYVNTDESEDSFRGGTWSGCLVDEIALYSDESVFADVGPALRQAGIPPEWWVTSNPHGSAWLDPWSLHEDFEPFQDPYGRWWYTFRGDFRDNPFISHGDLFTSLKQKMKLDPAVGRSWFTGEDTLGADFFFAHCFSEARSLVPQWQKVPNYGWTNPEVAIDPGGTAPSVGLLFVKATRSCVGGDGTVYPAGSIVFLDECDTAHEENVSLTWTQTLDGFAQQALLPMTDSWKIVRPRAVVDDAAFSLTGHAQSQADILVANGIACRRAHKGRREDGLARMRTLMANAAPAGQRTEPGFYLCPRVQSLPRTLLTLRTHPKRKEDHVTDNVPDHWADAARYGIQSRITETSIQRMDLY